MADGRVLRASADENPDLFWAIRGGGGNFGIAASLEYNAASSRAENHRWLVVHPLPRRSRAALLPGHLRALPDELFLVAGLQTAPDGSNAKVVAILGGTLRIARPG